MRPLPEPLSPLAWRLHYSNRRDLAESIDGAADGVADGVADGAIDGVIDTRVPGAFRVVSESRATPTDHVSLSSSHS